MPILLESDLNVKLPQMFKVKQKFKGSPKISDINKRVIDELSREKIKSLIHPGDSIAIAIGSRGINKIDVIAKQMIDSLKEAGAQPFIVSAMGSHGGGTAKGQMEVLESLRITPETMGVPVITDETTVKLGETSGGYEVYFDKTALDADMTIMINRVKAHTDFTGEIESGLCKMAVIGLGNHKGCSSIHKAGFSNFTDILIEASDLIFYKTNIGFGLTIVENSHEEVCMMEAIITSEIHSKEPELLARAKQEMPKLYFPEIDVLLVEEIGKNISGNGSDPNIVGRHGPKAFEPGIPKVKYMVTLGLSEETHGNAIGIGMADITTRSVFNQIDLESTYANSLAAGDVKSAMIPIIMEDEKEAIAAAIKLYGGDSLACKMVRIKNTLELTEIEVSEALMPYIQENTDLFDIEK